jgi:ABC-type glycerol-3-phosphate transport system permease component
MNRSTANLLVASLKVAVLAGFTVMILVPFFFVISASLMPASELLGDFQLLPREPTLEQYVTGFDNLRGNLINSALAAGGTAILTLVIAIPGSYVFAREEFPGKRIAFLGVLTSLMFPYVLLIVPITNIWVETGLYNTIPGLIIAFQLFITPFVIWILRDYFENLPPNLEECAQVYGCTEFSAFVRIVLPISIPAVLSTTFISFVIGWQEFLFSNMLTTGLGPRPATVSLYLSTVGGELTFWGQVMAQTVIIGTPTAVLYFIARSSLSESFQVS